MPIAAEGVSAGYGRHSVLQGVSLEVRPGEFVGLIGPNGAGKSTLLRALSRVLKPHAGRVVVDGVAAEDLSARDLARRIAFVPQAETTLFEFTVREVVLMGRHARTAGPAGETQEDRSAALRAMASTDTLHLADRSVTSLSGGEHRRVLIARALAQGAPTIFLDEPTAHLDLTHQADVLALVRRLTSREGVAALAALHDLNLAAEYCDRLVLLVGGHVAADGAPEQVLTPSLLSEAYGAAIHVGRSPTSGMPFVFPCPLDGPGARPSAPRVHVVCGGGTGLALLSGLLRRGYTVTAGVLNRTDTDEQAAAALGIECVAEAPFSPIGEAARAACAGLMARAMAVVVAEVPFGNGNLANLSAAMEALRQGVPVYLIGCPSLAGRDFTGGAAGELWAAAIAAGAHLCPNVEALEAALAARFAPGPGAPVGDGSRAGAAGSGRAAGSTDQVP